MLFLPQLTMTQSTNICPIPRLLPVIARFPRKVFKITLPCSGKVNDELDVQVLINITGQIEQQDSSADLESDLLDAANAQIDSASSSSSTQVESMQSDQAVRWRQVSHTLTIKRKKICTAHPLPVQARPAQSIVQHQPQPQLGALQVANKSQNASWPAQRSQPTQTVSFWPRNSKSAALKRLTIE